VISTLKWENDYFPKKLKDSPMQNPPPWWHCEKNDIAIY